MKRKFLIFILAILIQEVSAQTDSSKSKAPKLILPSILQIKSDPAGAEVFINNIYLGITPFQDEVSAGTYSITVREELYEVDSAVVTIKEGETRLKTFSLKPKFGILQVLSTPLSGADVFLDSVMVGMTPFRSKRLPEGTYSLRVTLPFFKDHYERITVGKGNVETCLVALQNNSGKITVHAPFSTISLDGKEVGTEFFTTRLIAGKHTIAADRSWQYLPVEQKFELAVDQHFSVLLHPAPRLGSASVMIENEDASDADVFVNDSLKGKAPFVIPLIIGSHHVIVSKSMYRDEEEFITVRENENTKVKFTMITLDEARLQSINRWNYSKWISGGVGILATGAAIYFNIQADKNFSSYNSAATHQQAAQYRSQTTTQSKYFSVSLSIAAVTTAFSLFSWLEEEIQ